jgi:hypothetical protein
MAKCVNCDYPYSTASVCPNCGSKDPNGIASGGCLIVFAILAVVIFFLSPGIFVTSFIHHLVGLKMNIIWLMDFLISVALLGYLYFNYRESMLKFYLLICGGVVLIVLFLSLLIPGNIFLKTLGAMFNQKNTMQTSVGDCVRCGGDGNINEQELAVFLESSVLTDTSTIMYFQDWMDKNEPFWIEKSNKYYNLRIGSAAEPERHIGGEGYGKFGPQTSNAFKLYKYDCFGGTAGENNCLLCNLNKR